MSDKTSLYLFAAVLLFCSCFAHGQGAVSTGSPVATNGVGQPLGGLTVAICNANPGATPGSLCSGGALVTTYTDITLDHACAGTLTALNNQNSPTVTSGCSNPGLTDGQGNVIAFASPGTYWCEYQGPPLIGIQVEVCIFPSGAGAGFYQLLEDNGSALTQRPTLNLIPGSGQTISCVDNSGATRTDCTLASSAASVSITAASPIVATPSPLTGTGVLSCPTCNVGAPLPSSPQVGDIPRYNVNADSAWDAVNYSQKQAVIFFSLGQGSIEAYGAGVSSPGVASPAGRTVVYPSTYGDSPGNGLVSTSSASTNTLVGVSWEGGGNYGDFPFGSWYRWTNRFAANQTTNARYWMGMGSVCNGGVGQNGTAILTSTAYATDTPNKSTIGFRYSAGTDTTWQAVAITAGSSTGAQTTVNTSVAIDTNPHTFEIVPVIASGSLSAYNYFIDHAQVASITTNLPSGIYGGTCDPFAETFWTGDNKNTANAVSGTFYYMTLSLR